MLSVRASSAESHTIPVTVAAEQGVIGLAAYAWLLWTARSRSCSAGCGGRCGGRPARVVLVARCVVAAAFCALLLHTLVYAAFLEDPLTWALLAIAAALRRVDPEGRSGFRGPIRARRPFRPSGFLPCSSVRRPSLVIAAAAVTVLLGAGGAAAAYLAFLQPEPKAPTPHALPAPFPTPAPTAAPKRQAEAEGRHVPVAPVRLLARSPALVQPGDLAARPVRRGSGGARPRRCSSSRP